MACQKTYSFFRKTNARPVFVLEEKELFSYGAGKQFSLLELLPSTLVTRKKEVFSKRNSWLDILP
jgi:hypothetical protein